MDTTSKPKEDRMTFDKEVDRVLKELSAMSVDSEEYAKAVKNLNILREAQSVKTNRTISMDTLVTVGANILGIVLVLNYEQMHVITTKAISFVFKGRV